MGRKAPRKRLAYRVISAFTRVCDAHDTPHGCLARTRTFLGAPPTPRFGVSEATMQNPGANAPRERDGLFDIVRWESANGGGEPRTRVILRTRIEGFASSARLEGRRCTSSCFETHRSAAESWARLCSHLRCDAPQHEGAGAKNQPAAVGTDHPLRSIASGLLFTMRTATLTCRARVRGHGTRPTSAATTRPTHPSTSWNRAANKAA